MERAIDPECQLALLSQARRAQGLVEAVGIETAADAWQMMHAHTPRRQIEVSWRYNKSKLAMESPRVWTWERREKLLLMVTLVYALLPIGQRR